MKTLLSNFPMPRPVTPKRLEGKAAIHDYFKEAAANFELKEESPVIIHPSADPLLAIFETSAKFHIFKTGKDYQQDYIGVVKTNEDGKIRLYREYWDPLRGLNAFSPEDREVNQ